MREVFPIMEKSGNFKFLPESQGILYKSGKIRLQNKKYQVVKVSPGGSLTGSKALLPHAPSLPLCPLAPTEVVGTMGCIVPNTSVEVRGSKGE